MTVTTIPQGILGTNVYIFKSEDEICIIDPAFDATEIIYEVKKMGGSVKAILLTHGHFDHILAAHDLITEYACPIYVHEADEICLHNERACMCMGKFGSKFTPIFNAKTFYEGYVVTIGSSEITAMHTPGHTPGSCIFITEDVIFSGDTLFNGTIGRTDFPRSSPHKMIESLKKISEIEGEYKIYPGHEGATTLSSEKKRLDGYIRLL